MKNIFKFRRNKPIILETFDNIKINELFEEECKISGFLVKNFLNKEELNSIINAKKMKDKNNFSELQEGFLTYPNPLAHDSKEDHFNQKIYSNYFKESEDFRNSFCLDFKVDLEKKLKDFFLLKSQINIDVPKLKTQNNSFTPYSLRVLKSNIGKMYLHCGNFVQECHKDFYNELENEINIKNQLSYFIMLQKPIKGGGIKIYNTKWKDINKRTPNEMFVTNSGKLLNPENQGYIDIIPENGDMLIFSGGQHWHKVETPIGDVERITIGGFIGRSKHKDKLYIWS